MRFAILVKATDSSETGSMPTEDVLNDVVEHQKELADGALRRSLPEDSVSPVTVHKGPPFEWRRCVSQVLVEPI